MPRVRSGFNEAACNTGGTQEALVGVIADLCASMRPPAIQAERRSIRVPADRPAPASMRPPAIQAERFRRSNRRNVETIASMRPPAIQAERADERAAWRRMAAGFNEAACNTGGTPHLQGGIEAITAIASMRPPAIQAER